MNFVGVILQDLKLLPHRYFIEQNNLKNLFIASLRMCSLSHLGIISKKKKSLAIFTKPYFRKVETTVTKKALLSQFRTPYE